MVEIDDISKYRICSNCRVYFYRVLSDPTLIGDGVSHVKEPALIFQRALRPGVYFSASSQTLCLLEGGAYWRSRRQLEEI